MGTQTIPRPILYKTNQLKTKSKIHTMTLHDYQKRCADFIAANMNCILSVDMGLGKTAADNRISAKWFVDFFVRSMGAEAHKRRSEILEAARMVFGDKYNDRFWLLDDLRKRADELARGDGDGEEDETVNKLDEDTEKLPF